MDISLLNRIRHLDTFMEAVTATDPTQGKLSPVVKIQDASILSLFRQKFPEALSAGLTDAKIVERTEQIISQCIAVRFMSDSWGSNVPSKDWLGYPEIQNLALFLTYVANPDPAKASRKLDPRHNLTHCFASAHRFDNLEDLREPQFKRARTFVLLGHDLFEDLFEREKFEPKAWDLAKECYLRGLEKENTERVSKGLEPEPILWDLVEEELGLCTDPTGLKGEKRLAHQIERLDHMKHDLILGRCEEKTSSFIGDFFMFQFIHDRMKHGQMSLNQAERLSFGRNIESSITFGRARLPLIQAMTKVKDEAIDPAYREYFKDLLDRIETLGTIYPPDAPVTPRRGWRLLADCPAL